MAKPKKKKYFWRLIPYGVASIAGFGLGFKFGYEISGTGLATLTGIVMALICNFMMEYVVLKLFGPS
jgi:putative flippase GtrA